METNIDEAVGMGRYDNMKIVGGEMMDRGS
jgi:hypothetical protein